MEVYRVKTGSILPLGKQGENLVRQIQFDLSRWISNFGPGTVQLLHQRSSDEAPYPVAVEQEGNLAVWTVTSADTAAAGTGRAELQYYVGDSLAKSETWITKVLPALGDASETPPEAQQGWVDQVLQAGAAAAEAADRAEEAAVRQPYPNAETGTWWVWNAESGAYEDTGISYGTGDSGGGVTDHEKLSGRDKANQHPMSAITGLEDALAGKQPTGNYLTSEQDPTVPKWAKQPQKPAYTAQEVGALPDTTHIPSTADDVNAEPAGAVSQHNVSDAAHSDIRLLIQGLSERLSAVADSDDTTLDQLSEIVAYIKSNRSLIEAITTSKVSVADIIDNLTTNVTNKPLSSAQGVALKAMIDAITIPTALPNPNALTFTGAVSGSYDGSSKMSARIPQVVSWANKELFDKADLVDPDNINSFVTVDGVEYYRYHAGGTYGFTWNNPHPLPGSVTITARGVSQYGGSRGTRLKTIYDDGTYGPDLYIVASGESKTATVTTDASKTLEKITGNYDLEDWVLLDMSVMSIVANYNVGVPLADSNVPGGIKADPATETDTVPAKIGADGKLYVPDMSGGGGGIVSGDYIPVPSTAEVGQTIVVKAVDEDGKPTEWEAVDMASGGGEKPWRYDKLIEFSEDTAGFTLDTFDDGSPFDFTEIEVRAALKNASANNVWGDLTIHSDGMNENSMLQSIGGSDASVSVFTYSGKYYFCLIQGYIDISAKTIHGIINVNTGNSPVNASTSLVAKLTRQDVNYIYGVQGKPNAWKIAPTKLARVTSSMQIGAGSYVWVRGR